MDKRIVLEPGSLQVKELFQYFDVEQEEKNAVFGLAKKMANEACLKEAGQWIEDYNKDLEIAESEPVYIHEAVMNKMASWLANKKTTITTWSGHCLLGETSKK